jgi:hypothetical protein
MMRNVEEKYPVFGSEQFHGRLRHRVQLPHALNEADLSNVARAIMPEASDATTMLLVGHAMKSKGRIAAIESAVTRDRFFAAEDARAIATFTDVEAALIEAGSASQDQREGVATRSLIHRERANDRLVLGVPGRLSETRRRRQSALD